ncbi:hypothetical protein MD484_g8558, partial [Candolleomyces efflorescens]
MYTCVKSLQHHNDTVNCLSLTEDARYLASGDDNGLVIVADVKDHDRFDRYHFKDAVTSLLWLSGSGTPKLVVGLANCEIHFIALEEEQAYTLNYAPAGYVDLSNEWKQLIQISSLAYDPSCKLLAIAVGVRIVILSVRNFQKGHFRERSVIGPVGHDPLKDGLGPAPNALASEVTSIHFLNNGEDLLATFLEEGIRLYSVAEHEQRWRMRAKSYRIGPAAVDSNETFMVCSNLFNGFDLYNIKEHQHIRTIYQDIPRTLNVMLPVLFVRHNSELAILLGSATGHVQIVSFTGEVFSKLTHNNEIIQAIAFGETPEGVRIVATGPAEKETETSVRIWVQPRTSNESDSIRRQLKEEFLSHQPIPKHAMGGSQPSGSSAEVRRRKQPPVPDFVPVNQRQHAQDVGGDTSVQDDAPPSFSCANCATLTLLVLFAFVLLSLLVSTDRLVQEKPLAFNVDL